MPDKKTRKSRSAKSASDRSPSRKAARAKSGRSPRGSKGSVAKPAFAIDPPTRDARVGTPPVPASDTINHISPTLGDLDLHLFGEGKHLRIYDKLGAHAITHEGKRGVSFAVWAPAADSVSVVGNFNDWKPKKNSLRRLGSSGVWELFIPGLKPGELYKYAISTAGHEFFKADPYASMMEVPPDTSSIVFKSNYKFHDRAWLTQRRKRQAWREPSSIYEVRLGSWRRITEEEDRPLTYREIAPLLSAYVKQNGFTHVEFLPLKEHPYGPSWGYQVSPYSPQ